MKSTIRIRKSLKLWVSLIVVVATVTLIGLPRVLSAPPSTYVVSNETVVGPSSANTIITVNCNPGDVATGGGFSVPTSITLVNSLPIPFTPVGVTPTGWRIDVTSPASGGVVVFVYAVCHHG